MERIAEIGGRPLRWSQPSAGRTEYELRAGPELVATLVLRSMFGTLATAESGDGCWTFKRVGFCETSATIRARGSEANLAVFRHNTWDAGGTLELPDGARFRATTNLWRDKFEFWTEPGELLVAFRYGGVFRRSADVEILPPARGLPVVPLLVLFGWYLVLMMDRDNAAVTTAAIG